MLGTGVAGEFWPIIVMSIFLTGVYGAGTEVALLVVFGGVAVAAAVAALHARPGRILTILRETLDSTGQAGVRLSLFVLAGLLLIAKDVGFDFILGAFAAGLVVGLAIDNPEGRVVRMRLEGIGFGFLIPVYFVTTGLTFDVDSLLSVDGLALAAMFLVLLLAVRGVSALLWLRELGARPTVSLAFYGATALPLIVALVSIGNARGAIGKDVAASLIGAGMISVLVYPLLAGLVERAGGTDPSACSRVQRGVATPRRSRPCAARARTRSAAAPRPRSRCARPARARAARRPRRPRRGARRPRTTAASASSCTDFGSSPSMPVGRTSPHAWTKPDSSSQANSVFFSGVSRGMLRGARRARGRPR